MHDLHPLSLESNTDTIRQSCCVMLQLLAPCNMTLHNDTLWVAVLYCGMTIIIPCAFLYLRYWIIGLVLLKNVEFYFINIILLKIGHNLNNINKAFVQTNKTFLVFRVHYTTTATTTTTTNNNANCVILVLWYQANCNIYERYHTMKMSYCGHPSTTTTDQTHTQIYARQHEINGAALDLKLHQSISK